MTSKESVKELYKERAYAYEDKVCNKGDGWKEAIDHYDNIGKCLIQIEKDLDVLEILKPHLINAGIGTYDNVNDYEILHLKLTLSGEEYNKIKEWLNDIH